MLSTLTTPYDQRINNEEKTNDYLLQVDNELVVPVDKKIRLVLTANDVIHAWSVPALGVKQDTIPGFVRDSWFKANRTGTFVGQCSELCGKDHAFMPIAVKVVSAEEYSEWASQEVAKLKGLNKDENIASDDDPTSVAMTPTNIDQGDK